jgi:hypothetical protein
MSDLVERLRALVILDEVRSVNTLGQEAADRIAALEAALREITELCAPSDCPDGALLTIDRIARFALGPEHYRTTLAPEQEK